MPENSLITKEELVQVLKHVAGAYPRFFILSDESLENMCATYYYFLQYYGRNDVWKVACDLIKNNDNAPTIHMFLDKLDRRERLRSMGAIDD